MSRSVRHIPAARAAVPAEEIVVQVRVEGNRTVGAEQDHAEDSHPRRPAL